MHRDKKVGLALAILLCSIVGAFFFRDDAPRTASPELKDPDRLDQEIAHRGRTPYAESGSRSRDADPRRSAERSRGNAGDLPDWLPWDETPGQGTAQRNRVNSSRDPLFADDRASSSDISTLPPAPHEAPAVPIPLHNSEWDTANNDGTGIRRDNAGAGSTNSKGRTHTVADGETLSSIAGKYLGSQARYQEIFQANRDQLKSPNDLKIGMKLNIPERSDARVSNTPRNGGTSSRDAGSQTVKTLRPATTTPTKATDRTRTPSEPTSSGSSKPLFKPAKRGPAIPRTTDASDEEDSLDKSLSQLTPQNVLEVDDGILAELERDLDLPVAEKPAVPQVAQAVPSEAAESSDEKDSNAE